MNRGKFIGQRKGSSLLTLHNLRFTFHSSRFTLYASLITVLMSLFTIYALLFTPHVMAADKLVVKDAAGVNTEFVVTDTGFVGLSVANPVRKLDFIANDTGDAGIGYLQETTYRNTSGAGGMIYRKARGTRSLPSILQNGDLVNSFIIKAYDGVSFLTIADIEFKVDGAPGTNDMPGRIEFYITPDGSSGPYAAGPRMVITNSGSVGIGTTDPQGKLDVNGAIYQRGSELHADYVFEPTYKMESIEKHARYMWENKHLSAVPGVRKDENGKEIVEVGSHQRGILEELEKAHIYIEQLNEKVKALEAKLKALESIK